MAAPVIISYAMPIGHNESGNFDAFAGAVTIGRAFRQPFNFDGNQSTFAPGIEFVLNDDDPVPDLFAFADGFLRWTAATSSTESRLVLDFDTTAVMRHIHQVFYPQTLEAPPVRAIFQNVDKDRALGALENLLVGSHPALAEKVAGKNQTVAQFGVDKVLQRFFAGDRLFPLRVRAGDRIGVAGPAGAAAAGKRRSVFIMQDLGGQELNPFFFIQTFIAAEAPSGDDPPPVSTKSKTPLLPAQPVLELLAANAPHFPRAETDIPDGAGGTQKQIPFSFGPLGIDHGFPIDTVPKSGLKRRLISAPSSTQVAGQLLVADAKTGAALAIKSKEKATAVATISTLWSRSGAAVNAVARLLSVPAELILAILGTETRGGGLAYRLEPLKDSERALLRASEATQPLEEKYDKTVGVLANVNSVDRRKASLPKKLTEVRTEADGRPRSKLHVTLAGGTRDLSKWVDQWQAKAAPKDPRRHILFVGDSADSDLVHRPLLRTLGLVTGSQTQFDLTMDDQQLDCNRQGYKAKVDKDGNPISRQPCMNDSVDEPQLAGKTLFYDPTDACQDTPGSATATDDVVAVIPRDGVLRGLYVDAKANAGATTVTIFKGADAAGLTATSLAATLAANKLAVSNTSTELEVSAGDRISLQVKTTSGASKGIRVRVHLSPDADGQIYMLDGCGHTGASGVSNPYPLTGVKAASHVRGADTGTEHPLTWAELATATQALGGSNISPGIAQTLISAGEAALISVEKVLPNLYDSLQSVGITHRPVAAATNDQHFGRYLIDPADPNTLGWLMKEPNAILAGACHIRLRYLRRSAKSEPSGFDLPAVCAGYNTGHVSKTSKQWGVNIKEDYIKRALVFYNAAVSFFEGSPAPDPIPAVRFRA